MFKLSYNFKECQMKILFCIFIAVATLTYNQCGAASPTADDAEQSRPSGKNCNLSAPPDESGEEGGHGLLLQVFPRAKDIDSTYTGCQAIFVTAKNQNQQLGWLVQVIQGDPVRLWSPDERMRDQITCKWTHGSLASGDPKKCKVSPTLMPSQPAGCITKVGKVEQCNYDSE